MQLLLNIYFETKYILFLFQLFEERSKVDLDEAAQVVWDTLSPAAMSDQEFDDEKQIHVNRTIPWRSEIVTNLIKQIDISLKVIRVYGEPSLRDPDPKCAAFVADDYMEERSIRPGDKSSLRHL